MLRVFAWKVYGVPPGQVVGSGIKTKFEMRDGVAFATDWWAIIFNPSMPYRLAHMLLASGLTVAFLLAGISAYRWLRAQGADRSQIIVAGDSAGGGLALALLVAIYGYIVSLAGKPIFSDVLADD